MFSSSSSSSSILICYLIGLLCVIYNCDCVQVESSHYDVRHVAWSDEGRHMHEALVIHFVVDFSQPLLLHMSDAFPPRNIGDLNADQLAGFTRMTCAHTHTYESVPSVRRPFLDSMSDTVNNNNSSGESKRWISVLRLPVNVSKHHWYDPESPHDFERCALHFLEPHTRLLDNEYALVHADGTSVVGEVRFKWQRLMQVPAMVSSSLALRSANIGSDADDGTKDRVRDDADEEISLLEVKDHVMRAWKHAEPRPKDEPPPATRDTSNDHVHVEFEDHRLSPLEQQNMRDVVALIQVGQKLRHMDRSQSQSRMIYELVIKPIINIIRRLATQATEKFLAMTMVNLLLHLISSLVTLFSTQYIAEDELNVETAHHLPNPIEDFEPVLHHFGCEMEGGRRHSVWIGRPPSGEHPDCNQVFNSRQDEPFAVSLTLLQIWESHQSRHRTHAKSKGRLRGGEWSEHQHRVKDRARFRELMKAHAEDTDLLRAGALSEARFLQRLMARTKARNKAEVKAQAAAKAQMQLRARLRLMSLQAAKLRAYATVNAGSGVLERFNQKMEAVVSNKHRLNFVTKPVLDMLEPRLFDELSESVTIECQLQLEKTLTIDLLNEIKEYVNITCVRDVTRRLVTKLTEDLSHNVVQTTAQILTKDLTELVTKRVTLMIIPELTFALVIPIAKALTRAPVCDYYCHFCFLHKLYCTDCQSCMLGEYYLDYYSHYFTTYYAPYYAKYYAYYYSMLFSNDMRKAWFWGGTHEHVTLLNPQEDSENDVMPVGSHEELQTPRQNHIDVAPGFIGQIRAF